MPRALKLFRTAIGFHDAYVAAPSRKAALDAWGTDKDLFARGVAEQVDDRDLFKRLAETPGEVFRRARGSAKDHLDALPPEEPAPKKQPRAPKPPRPKNDAVRKARAALDALESEQADEAAALRRKEAELARERRVMEQAHVRALDDAQRQLEELQAEYDRALAKWHDA
ncbi:type IV secretory pathway VirB10-like protein [Novosphingobium hassiacum]|uniref:Type IV secretory pathway VirB10-like protein n=1 Tax=Novosphingobium hassiacum TaxID=173676 RepID=A0A7W5ZRQ9_9SPHN|nr:hypothetical protein [Novosphingobium hassiacum]MBB3858786.1 type IV secretory pathway VirB10-like protein [Novosphingobium hassiacum]